MEQSFTFCGCFLLKVVDRIIKMKKVLAYLIELVSNWCDFDCACCGQPIGIDRE